MPLARFYCPWSAVDRLSQSFPFQNVRFDRTVKRARLEQSGVKSTADIAGEFVRGNEHRLGQFGHFIHI